MDKHGFSLVEIVASMVVLAVVALAAAATVTIAGGNQIRTAGGSSLELQALNFARQTLEDLKVSVSTDAARSAALADTSYTAPCSTPTLDPCGDGTEHTPTGVGTSGLPDSHLQVRGGRRRYVVQDISSGTGVSGSDVAYKKVTVTVDSWVD